MSSRRILVVPVTDVSFQSLRRLGRSELCRGRRASVAGLSEHWAPSLETVLGIGDSLVGRLLLRRPEDEISRVQPAERSIVGLASWRYRPSITGNVCHGARSYPGGAAG